VHLFTNQTFGTWEAEVELCLRQARGYLGLLARGRRRPDPRLAAMTEAIDRFLGS
jgi:hypothetical protein